MLSSDILKKIRHIEIHTRKILSSGLVGDHRVAQKGYGLEFEQLADYHLGDDIRFIDWKSSARAGKLLIKEYRQERSRTIYLVVDFSSSSLFATSVQLKKEMIAQIGSVLALVSNYAKDLVGLVIFSDTVEFTIPPSRGTQHIHQIMTHLFTYQPQSKKTSIKNALNYLLRLKCKDSIVFLLSDFIDTDYTQQLRLVAKRCDVVAVRCLDKKEYQLPSIGLLRVADIETGTQTMLDLRKKNNTTNTLLTSFLDEQTHLFKKNGIDYLTINSGTDFVLEIVRFMRKRMNY